MRVHAYIRVNKSIAITKRSFREPPSCEVTDLSLISHQPILTSSWFEVLQQITMWSMWCRASCMATVPYVPVHFFWQYPHCHSSASWMFPLASVWVERFLQLLRVIQRTPSNADTTENHQKCPHFIHKDRIIKYMDLVKCPDLSKVLLFQGGSFRRDCHCITMEVQWLYTCTSPYIYVAINPQMCICSLLHSTSVG